MGEGMEWHVHPASTFPHQFPLPRLWPPLPHPRPPSLANDHPPPTASRRHADGTDGEATVLVTLEDVPTSLGCLGVIPGSHAEYSTEKARVCAGVIAVQALRCLCRLSAAVSES